MRASSIILGIPTFSGPRSSIPGTADRTYRRRKIATIYVSFSSFTIGLVGLTYGVPGLDENSARAGELAHKSFTGSEARDDTARSDALHHVLAVPRDEMTVVGNVLLTIDQLLSVSSVPESDLVHLRLCE